MSRRLRWRLLALAGCLALLLAGIGIYWHGWPSGQRLNRRAHDATYAERALPVPVGPREGWWGAKLGKKVPDAKAGWYEAEGSEPGKFRIDARGFQHVTHPSARAKVLILGGSVAWGATASDEAHTYFARLSALLAARGQPVAVSVLAAGAWVAGLEVRALQERGLLLRPDLVVFLHGLNDLTRTQQRQMPMAERPQAYMNAAVAARDLLGAHKIPVVFVLQPFLPDKAAPSWLEARILALAFAQPAAERGLRAGYPLLRIGLTDLASQDPAVTFLDASGVLSGETATTFIDLWHFTDPGHELLAQFLAERLSPLLPAAQSDGGG